MSLVLTSRASAATVGTVIPIVGQPRGLVYDATRKLLFIANTTQNRIEVYSTERNQLQASIPVGHRPVGIDLVPGGNLLLVCNSEDTFLTLIEVPTLTTAGAIPVTARSTLVAETPYSVAALSENVALLSTNAGLQRVDLTARTTDPIITSGAGFTTGGFTVPANVNLVPSSDRQFIFGQGGRLAFLYNLRGIVQLRASGSSPALAADPTGSRFMIGASQFDRDLVQTAQIFPPTSTGQLPPIGGAAFSSDGSNVFLGINQKPGSQIQVRGTATLKLVSTFQVPEPITGNMLTSPSGELLFAISESGITVVNLSALSAAPSLKLSNRLLYFSASLCSLAPITRTFQITNSGGGAFSWTASTTAANVTLQPASGTGPSALQVTIDPAKLSFRGTGQLGTVKVSSNESISGDQFVSLLLNLRTPDQIGAVYPVEGLLSDLLLDDARQRVYLVNSSENQVEVFSISQNAFLPPAAVGSIPKSIAFSPDKKQLLVTHFGAESIGVLDADTLTQTSAIRFPYASSPAGTQPGTLPFSIAQGAGGTILVAAAPGGGANLGTIYRVNPIVPSVTAFPNLGTANNSVSSATFLASSGNGAFIFVAQAGGMIHLYDNTTGNFAITRSSGSGIAGNVAASADGFWFHAGSQVFNSILIPQDPILPTVGGGLNNVAGFVFAPSGTEAYRGIRPPAQFSGLPSTTAPRIEKVDANALKVLSGFSIAEALAPNFASPSHAILRQLIVNNTGSVLYGITDSGLIVIPLPSLSPSSAPQISPGGVVNGASFAPAPFPVAAGSIAAIFGTNLTESTTGAGTLPLPTVLGGVCVTFDGFAAPLFSTSPLQLNVQVPWELAGRSTASVVVSGDGVGSLPLTVSLASTAPGVFTFSSDGNGPGAILHSSDFSPVGVSNPARIGEVISIYTTGLGPTMPSIGTGIPAPSDGPPYLSSTPTVAAIGGVNATVVFSGLAPGYAGLYQVNVRIPSNAPVGTNVPLVIRMGTRSSNQVSVAIIPAAP